MESLRRSKPSTSLEAAPERTIRCLGKKADART
jgi:hypothetical protein